MATMVKRRTLITGIAAMSLGRLIPRAMAQDKEISPEQAGEIHWEMMQKIAMALSGAEIDTPPGLSKLLVFLVEQKIISEQDRLILERMLDAIFKSANPDEIMKKLEQLEKEVSKTAGEVARELIRIAHTSVEYARKKYQEHPQVVKVVSADVSGGITGASVGDKIGGKKGAIAGVVIGAVGSSAWSAFSSKP